MFNDLLQPQDNFTSLFFVLSSLFLDPITLDIFSLIRSSTFIFFSLFYFCHPLLVYVRE